MTMTPDLIEKIKARTVKRTNAKKEFDSMVDLAVNVNKENNTCKLSVSSDGHKARLLDEGFIVDSEGYPYMYIKKGVLAAYYESLPDDYVGSVNLGHQSFATFPFLVGSWTKKDLTLVDIGDGRQGLDIKLNLDEDSIFIKELKKQDYPIGISSEFTCVLDVENSEEMGMEVISSLNIKDFAIVGEAGNVTSSNINLKGDGKMAKPNMVEGLLKKFLKSEPEEENKKNPEVTEKEQTDPNEDEVIEGITAEELAEVVEKVDEMQNERSEMLQVIEALNTENEELKEKNKELEASLSTREAEVNNGLTKFKELAAKLNIKSDDAGDKANKNKDEAAPSSALSDGWGEV